MIRRIPVLPTLLVLLAVGAMIALGVWQGFYRLPQKEALIAQGERARAMNAEAAWPRSKAEAEQVLYRHARVDCVRVLAQSARAGHNAQGQAGWAHGVRCALAGGGTADVVLGWSQQPTPVTWSGGAVGGIIAPGPRLVAAPAMAGLQDNEVPDPRDIPNNHFSYAVQWFLFAGVALVIYAVALRKRLSP